MTLNRFLTISEAAKILGISSRSLMRWDEEGIFSAREIASNNRVYFRDDVEMVKKWMDLRKKHRQHLKKLGPIRKELDKFLVITPLIPGKPIEHFWNIEDLRGPYNNMKEWEKIEDEITQEYSQFSGFKYHKTS
jgi:DNA-binding transcriptional MerR regulator